MQVAIFLRIHVSEINVNSSVEPLVWQCANLNYVIVFDINFCVVVLYKSIITYY